MTSHVYGSLSKLYLVLHLGLWLAVGGLAWAADPPPGSVRVQLLLDGQPAAARVSMVGSDGAPVAPAGAVVRRTKRDEPYFYVDGSFEVTLPPGSSRMQVSGGIEVKPQTLMLDPGASSELTVRLNRWTDMPAHGWYSGDSHIHLHTGGPLAATVADALLAARAEGVHFVNLCVSNNVGDDIRDANLITGAPHALSTARHLLVFGEEMRSSIYGHMQFFGIKRLVEPQYTGFDDTPQSDDYPANYVMAAEAVRQGGVVTYGHPMFAGQPDPFGDDLTAGSGAARELPVDAMLGQVHAVDLMSYNSDEQLSTELWYRLLNCGLKLAACVGTDALLDRSTDPLGGERVYVKIDGPLTMSSWLAGLKNGRTLVSNGPIPQLLVQGKSPGETLQLERPAEVRLMIDVASLVPLDRIEIIVNGKVAHRVDASGAVTSDEPLRVQAEVQIPLQRSSWLALRVQGPDHPAVFDGPAWAHTSPIYVSVGGQPISSAEDAAYFVEWIDRLLRVVAARNRYPSKSDREKVESLFRKAQAEYRRMASQND